MNQRCRFQNTANVPLLQNHASCNKWTGALTTEKPTEISLDWRDATGPVEQAGDKQCVRVQL
ncbi:MAG TPA: hypothetical protein DCE55_05715 [Planctomycetaceae bacterium]|nr:hypothetical protein [Planctomycetaceae bacterium]